MARRRAASPFASPGTIHLASEADLLRLQRGEVVKTVGKRTPKLKQDNADRAQLLAWDLEKFGIVVLMEKEWIAQGKPLAAGLVVREYHFTKYGDTTLLAAVPWEVKNWRNDFCFPKARLIVEVDGGQRATNGGHHGSQADMDKMTSVSLLGYTVMHLRADVVEKERLRAAERVLKVMSLC